MEHNVLRDDAPVAVELRPGVSFPDWSMVTTDIAHDTLQGMRRTLFLNPETGKLDVGPQHIFFCATRRWKLVEPTVHARAGRQDRLTL